MSTQELAKTMMEARESAIAVHEEQTKIARAKFLEDLKPIQNAFWAVEVEAARIKDQAIRDAEATFQEKMRELIQNKEQACPPNSVP